ncbi:MAG: phosphonate ABC transporter, permease protein PhnE [Spirochaetia bacterium]
MASDSSEDRPSRVPRAAAVAASILVPGAGQILTLRVRRGLLIFASMVSLIGMLIWRVKLLAPLEPGAWGMVAKAMSRRPGFVALVLLSILVIWVLNAFDAGKAGAHKRSGGFGIFALVLVAFFVLGWQLSEIDIPKMVQKFPEATKPFGKVIWPWQAAVTRDPVLLTAAAEIQVPRGATPPAIAPEEPGKPFLVAEPNYGELSSMDANNQVIPGSRIRLTGRGFLPGSETQIWWRDPLRNEFQIRQAGTYLSVKTDSHGSFTLEISMPYRTSPRKETGSETHWVEARQVSAMGKLRASEALLLTLERMVETIFMGMMATFFGIILSIPVSFLAARNIMSGSKLTLAIYYLTRSVLNIIRSIEPLIWALIAVVWVGLGPFAGIIALTVHSVASLGKLYSEAIESIDSGPIEAIQATGATRFQTIMFAVVPQMIAPFVSFSIYRWDINVRMSTVIGLVGGGGVGFILIQYIRLLDYRAAGIAVWFIAVTVAVLDYVSSEIRQRFV